MGNIYYMFFAKLYRFYLRIGEKSLPHFYSMAFISLFLWFNVSALLSFFEFQFYPNFHDRVSIPAGIAIYVINYFIFIYRKRYEVIMNEYEPSAKSIEKVFAVVVIIAYMILSISLWFYFGSLVRRLNLINS